ncbi:uracil-DNA glycosylase [Candidatus Palauibacter sp.]|uniref:uracil-DNA glycosylase n=1 Tax=Candidatus Palauibacter sp. TaxID=3101350 RepID=UPI003B52A5A9
MTDPALAAIEREVTACRKCPRLVEWRERVARERRAAFRDDTYWGRPVPGFGDPAARLLIVGLAPAAHGANRTGRMFTGDRSGDWLYRALHRAGFASQPGSTARHDGLVLRGAWVTAAVRCAPPANKPTAGERERCRDYLERELDFFADASVIVALGGFSFSALLRIFRERGEAVPRPAPKFGHCVEVEIGRRLLIGSYHPSQQNTFTGTLTEPMFDAVWTRAAELAGVPR